MGLGLRSFYDLVMTSKKDEEVVDMTACATVESTVIVCV